MKPTSVYAAFIAAISGAMPMMALSEQIGLSHLARSLSV